MKQALSLLFLVSILSSVQRSCFSSYLVDIAKDIKAHADIFIITETIGEENLSELVSLYFSSTSENVPSASLFPSNASVSESMSNKKILDRDQYALKVLLGKNTTEGTLSALQQIGKDPDSVGQSAHPSVVLVWPEEVENDAEAMNILQSVALKKSVKQFSIGSELIIVFQRRGSRNISEEDGDATPISMSSIEESTSSCGSDFCYEVYSINGQQINKVLGKGVVDFRCKDCQGIALRRTDFEGVTLRAVGVKDPDPNDDLYFETINGELMITQDGFSSKIIQILQKTLNFSIKVSKSANWGAYNSETKSWMGAVGDVLYGAADIGIGITVFRPSRAEVISFLPAADEHITFFRPPDLNAIRDIFARPFQTDLWAAVITTWLTLAFFMILFSVIRKRYGLHVSDDGTEEPDFTHDSFIWALATACQQGWDDHPIAGSLRTIFISGSFTGVIAYAGYSAAIVSTLSLRIDPIQSPSQLLDSSLKIGFREGFVTELLQQNGTNDIMTAFNRRLLATKEPQRYLSIPHGYEQIVKRPFAFVTPKDNLLDYLKATVEDKEICNLKQLDILRHGFPIGHYVSKTSPYKEFLRYMYVAIREPGILWKLRTNYTYTRRCLEVSDNSGKALGANDVFTAFMILVAGFVGSVIFLGTEKILRAGAGFGYIK